MNHLHETIQTKCDSHDTDKEPLNEILFPYFSEI